MKRILLLGSIILAGLRLDPIAYVQKFVERLRQAGIWAFQFEPKVKSDASKLLERGELSRGLDRSRQTQVVRIPSFGKFEGGTVQTIKLLATTPIQSALDIEPRKFEGALMLLNNSLPYTNSGYTQRSHSILTALQRHGVDVKPVTRIGYPLVVGKWPSVKADYIDGIEYKRLLPWFYPFGELAQIDRTVKMLNALIQDKEISVMHVTTGFPNAVIASQVALKNRMPWIYEIRGELESTWLSRFPTNEQNEVSNSELFTRWREQETAYARAASAVVVLSEISKSNFVERGIDESKIFVIPNSIDEKFLMVDIPVIDAKRKLRLPISQKIIGSVSSIVQYEGFDVLIEALLYLPVSYSVLLVGEGTERPALESLAAKLGVSDRVIFAGLQPSEGIEEWYSSIDIFVVPRRDTLVTRNVTPIKSLMAQALGIPVVASDLPALREVTGGVESYVVPENPKALADAILQAKTHERGKRWASNRTWRDAASKFEMIYQSVCSWNSVENGGNK